ncbi:MAG: hypoxanthine phosphoribosyltransferase [Deltaproteobacteria bacterium]|nr:MAG: hypoxanthine phosphoribosyltransferase [Deltaproteobacteria bacterium]
MSEQITKTLITQEEIVGIVAGLGRQITEAYQGIEDNLIVVGLLRGSFIFMADLVRTIKVPLVVDFLTVSSYGSGTVSSGDVKIVLDLDTAIENRDVLLVEDIVDTGNTFKKVIHMLQNRKPRSLKTCAFLSKPSRRKVEVEIDFCGRVIPDEFVCGYGLDFNQRFRELPYVGVLGNN